VQQRERPRRSATAIQTDPFPGQPRSLPQEDPEQSEVGLTRVSPGSGYEPCLVVGLVARVLAGLFRRLGLAGPVVGAVVVAGTDPDPR
jgi:hypothetical protein